MRSIRNIFITLVSLLFVSVNSYSLTYTTLAVGDWNNTTTVWSLDSLTLCGCSPSNTVSAHTININDSINLVGTLRLINGAQINISSNGKIIGPAYKVIVSNGSIDIVGGVLESIRLDIAAAGSVTVIDGLIEVRGQANIYGTITSTNSIVRLGTGNFTVHTGGIATIQDGSYLITSSGNIFIDPNGTLMIDDSCVQAAGNINNEGTMAGVGVVESLLGNVDNDLGVWSMTVDWCVPGNSTNMPLTVNCSYVQGVCGSIIDVITLPIDLVLFEVTGSEEGEALVQWVTASELNNDYFTIENSVDGFNWKEIMIMPGAGNSSDIVLYSFMHDSPEVGVSYYRLKQTDFDGAYAYSEISSMYIKGNGVLQQVASFEVFPVPSDGNITWEINTLVAGEYELSIYDISSRMVLSKKLDLNIGMNSLNEDVLSLSNGTYTIMLSTNNAQFLDSELLIIRK